MNMGQWWSARSPRERIILTMGGVAVAVLAMIFLLWLPLTERAQKAQQDFHAKRDLIAWMQTQVPVLLQLRNEHSSANAVDTHLTPLVIIERETKNASLAAYTPQIKQAQDDDVQIIFKTVPFDDLVEWLGKLGQRFGLHVVTANISQTDSVGIVQASLTLSR